MRSREADIIEYPTNRAIRLRNANCIYCGKLFEGDRKSTKEHVVGRRFVPRGCFDGQWNLIANACAACNSDKADLEDDISAISMLPDLMGRYAIDDPRLAAEAVRKAANARSRRLGKVVAESREEIKVEQNFGGATFTFSFVAPPQVDEARIYRLAHYHFRAFFFLISYNQITQRGGFVRGGFYPLVTARRADWGNPRMRQFMNLVRDWDMSIHAIGADTFFKMLIRKHPGGKRVSAWALEWNHSIRIVGLAGDEAAVREITGEFQDISFDVVHSGPERVLRMRTGEQLDVEQDDLFSFSNVVENLEAITRDLP